MSAPVTMGEPEDPRQIFFSNLLLLGFDPIAMERKWRIPFNKDMFLLPNKKGFETVMHYLFNKLNAGQCREEFRDCWPVNDKKREQQFRKVCNNWLAQIVKDDDKAVFPRIVASIFLSPGGDKFYELLLYFSQYVLLQVTLTQHGKRQRDFLQHPVLTPASQSSGLSDVQEKVLQCGLVRLRTRFLQQAQRTVTVQNEWKQYATELVKTFRGLTKSTRDKERELRNVSQQTSDRGLNKSSTLDMSKRRSMAADYDLDIQSVKRAQKVQKVRDLWRSLEGYLGAKSSQQEVVDSILEGTLEKYRLDTADLNLRVPDLLLRECEQEIHRRGVENIYQGGKLNLLSLIHLWNLCLHLYIEKLHQAGVPSFSEALPAVTTQVHTHNAHLTNIQSLRLKLEMEVLPDLKESNSTLKKRLEDTLLKNHSPNSLRTTSLGLGLLPPSPPVSFEPDDAKTPQDKDSKVPLTHNLKMPQDHASTPEAAVELINNVSQKVRLHQNALVQGSPVYGPGVRIRQAQEPAQRPPSKLPVRGKIHLETAGNKQRTHFKSPQTRGEAENSSQQHPTSVAHGKNLRVTSSGTTMETMSPGSQRAAKHDLGSQVKKGEVFKVPTSTTRQRKASSRSQKTVAPLVERHVEGAHLPGPAQTGAHQSQNGAHRPQNGAHRTRNASEHDTSVRSRHGSTPQAQRILADRIADAVVGGTPSEGLDYLQDPGSALSSVGFECRDKLARTPVTDQRRPGSWGDLLSDSLGPLSSTRVEGPGGYTGGPGGQDSVVMKLFSPQESDTEDHIMTLAASSDLRSDLARVRGESPALGRGPPSSISSISPRSDMSLRRCDDNRHSTLLRDDEHDHTRSLDNTLTTGNDARFLLEESPPQELLGQISPPQGFVSPPQEFVSPQTPPRKPTDFLGYVSPFGKTPQQREATANNMVDEVMRAHSPGNAIRSPGVGIQSPENTALGVRSPGVGGRSPPVTGHSRGRLGLMDSPVVPSESPQGRGLEELLGQLESASELYQSVLETKTPSLPARTRAARGGANVDQSAFRSMNQSVISQLGTRTDIRLDSSDSDTEANVRVIKFQDGSFSEFVDRSPLKKPHVHFATAKTKKTPSPKSKKSSPPAKKTSPLVQLQEELDSKTDSLIARYKQLKETALGGSDTSMRADARLMKQPDTSLRANARLTEQAVLRDGQPPRPLPLILNTPSASYLDSYLQTSPARGRYGDQAAADLTNSIVVKKFTLDIDDTDDAEALDPRRTNQGSTASEYSPGILDPRDLERGIEALHHGTLSPEGQDGTDVPGFPVSPFTDRPHQESARPLTSQSPPAWDNLLREDASMLLTLSPAQPPSPAVGMLVDL